MFQSEAVSFCWNTAVFPSMPPMVATLPFSPSEIGDPPDSEASAWYEAEPDGAWDHPSQAPSAPAATSLALVVFTGRSVTPADATPGARTRTAAATAATITAGRRRRKRRIVATVTEPSLVVATGPLWCSPAQR